MISAGELYWVLKLDAIESFFCWLGGLATAFFTLASIISLVCYLIDEIMENSKGIQTTKKIFKRFALALAVALLVLGIGKLIPTTKQMAAIIILPKIATQENVEALTGEAKEIYTLAKDCLKKLTETKETPEKSEVTK